MMKEFCKNLWGYNWDNGDLLNCYKKLEIKAKTYGYDYCDSITPFEQITTQTQVTAFMSCLSQHDIQNETARCIGTTYADGRTPRFQLQRYGFPSNII